MYECRRDGLFRERHKDRCFRSRAIVFWCENSPAALFHADNLVFCLQKHFSVNLIFRNCFKQRGYFSNKYYITSELVILKRINLNIENGFVKSTMGCSLFVYIISRFASSSSSRDDPIRLDRSNARQ